MKDEVTSNFMVLEGKIEQRAFLTPHQDAPHMHLDRQAKEVFKLDNESVSRGYEALCGGLWVDQPSKIAIVGVTIPKLALTFTDDRDSARQIAIHNRFIPH